MLKRETDKGFTWIGNKKLSKDSLLIEALGTLDELSSFLGLAASFDNKNLKDEITNLQKKLFLLGQDLTFGKPHFSQKEVRFLEEKIERFKKGKRQANFCLPIGETAWLHVCRSIARRLERRVVSLSKKEKVRPPVLVFLNRLSLLLFWMAS